jgi:hypothetical protein
MRLPLMLDLRGDNMLRGSNGRQFIFNFALKIHFRDSNLVKITFIKKVISKK